MYLKVVCEHEHEHEGSLELRDRCFSMYKDLRGDLILNGTNPKCVAAGIFYIACVMEGVSLRQTDVASLFFVTPQCIHKYYKLIGNHLGIFN